jgi:hypothetical protein
VSGSDLGFHGINHAISRPSPLREGDSKGMLWKTRSQLQIKTISLSLNVIEVLIVLMWKVCECVTAEVTEPSKNQGDAVNPGTTSENSGHGLANTTRGIWDFIVRRECHAHATSLKGVRAFGTSVPWR